jgi:GLPGLI family protein
VPEIHIIYDYEYYKFEDSKKKKTEQTILVVRPTNSFFAYKKSYNLAVVRIDKEVSETGVLMYNVKPNFVIESTHSNNDIKFYEYMGGKIYSYVENNDLKWTFHEETRDVLGYTVHKVSTNYGSRSWTGWYCKDIPLNRGPYKFNGLPGALLEITSDDGLFSYKATDIYQLEKQLHIETLNFMLEPEKDKIEISKEKLNQFRKKYHNLSSSERAYFNRSNKNATYTMMTIDESGEKKPVESRSRQRNYIEKTVPS